MQVEDAAPPRPIEFPACVYVIARPCSLKSEYGPLELAAVLGHPDLTELLFEGLRRARPDAPAPAPLALVAELGGDPLRLSLGAEELLRRCEAIYRLRRRCRDCPANRHPHVIAGLQALGCIGSVPLPVRGPQEEAMLGVVEEILERAAEFETTATLPVRFIWDNGLEGAGIRALRGRRDVFERSEAVEARIGPFLQKQLLDTNQFLSLFFLPGKVRLPYLGLFSPFFAEFVRLAAQREGEELDLLSPLIRLGDAMTVAAEIGMALDLAYLRVDAPTAAARTSPVPLGDESSTAELRRGADGGASLGQSAGADADDVDLTKSMS